jgi:hypothetical protein
VALHRPEFYGHPVAAQMLDGFFNRAKPLKTQIAAPWWHRDPGHWPRIYTRPVAIELLRAKAISPANVTLDQLGPEDVSVKRVGSIPFGHMDYAVIKPRPHLGVPF